MREALKQLAPFRTLDDAALAVVERHARSLRLPAQRWLLRGGGRLSREMFLLRGTVAARRDGAVEQRDAATLNGESLNGWAAGASDLSTLTEVELLSVELEPLRRLLADAASGNGAAPRPEVAGVDNWMHMLLHGPVMRWFSPGAWARVLRAGRLRETKRDERLLAKGEVAACVFVVARGLAEAASQQYRPGDFFGEESALGRRPSREDVRMRTDGALVCFARADLVELASNYAPPRMNPPPRRLDLDTVPTEREETAIADLDAGLPVAVRCSDVARRLMVATRLMRRGFHVV